MANEHDDPTSAPKDPGKVAQASARRQRLASEMRTNLLKRKAPQRSAKAAASAAGLPDGTDDSRQ